MSAFVIRAAGRTEQGLRDSNEDRFAIDPDRPILVVADGMGGQEVGERAAELAVEMLPRLIAAGLDGPGQPEQAVDQALRQANGAVLALSQQLGMGRRCGAAVIVAIRWAGRVCVGWLGDCRGYHFSGHWSHRLTEDHDVRTALVRTGTFTREQAERERIRNVLYRHLGCEWSEGVGDETCRSFPPQPGDRLLLATDGVWRFLQEGDLPEARLRYPEPQACADHLVDLALSRGSRDNATCIVAAFDPVRIDRDWLTWNGGTVARLARAAREDRDFGRLPVLADALEEAGCTERAVLDHCRGPGPHGPGCWALDLFLEAAA